MQMSEHIDKSTLELNTVIMVIGSTFVKFF